MVDHLRTHGPQSIEALSQALKVSSEAIKAAVHKSPQDVRLEGMQVVLPQHSETQEVDSSGRLDRFVVLDLETTDRDPEVAEILQVAALKVVQGQVVDRLNLLVKHPHVPRQITELTGITTLEVQQHGHDLHEVLLEVQRFLGDFPVVGHNLLAFDWRVLDRHCQQAMLPLKPTVKIDTLLYAGWLLSSLEAPPEIYQLGSLYTRLTGIIPEGLHRADQDCQVTLEVLQELQDLTETLPEDRQQWLSMLPLPEMRFFSGWTPPEARGFLAKTEGFLKVKAQVKMVNGTGQQQLTLPILLRSPREGQMTMAREVQGALLMPHQRLVVEAPTGTGKTRAYLFPALAASLSNRDLGPVYISTFTKQLQDQVLSEAESIGKDFAFKLMVKKGVKNYFCPLQLHEHLQLSVDSEGNMDLTEQQSRALALLVLHADKGEFSDIPANPVMRTAGYHVLRERSQVNTLRCKESCAFHSCCAYFPLHQQERQANVVVVNHTLLLQRQNALEPEHQEEQLPIRRVVVDEAHEFAEAAQNALRRTFSLSTLQGLLNKLWRESLRKLPAHRRRDISRQYLSLLDPHRQYGNLGQRYLDMKRQADNNPEEPQHLDVELQKALLELQSPPPGLLEQYHTLRSSLFNRSGLLAAIQTELVFQKDVTSLKHTNNLITLLGHFSKEISELIEKAKRFTLQYGRGQSGFGFQASIDDLTRKTDEYRQLEGGFFKLKTLLERFVHLITELKVAKNRQDEWQHVISEFRVLQQTLAGLLEYQPNDEVYAVGYSEDHVELWSTPLWVRSRLHTLWDHMPVMVFTSATLRIPGSGPAVNGEGDVEDFALFEEELALEKARYLVLKPVLPYHLSHVLFANHLPLYKKRVFSDLVGQEINQMVPQLPGRSLHIFTANERLRGAAGKLRAERAWSSQQLGSEVLLHKLRNSPQSHGLGSAGFIQGVDVHGLSVVSLDRTPFPIPDIILEKQRQAMTDFNEYWEKVYLPRGIIKFVQAYGRLIRQHDRVDEGAFLLWDRRLATASYQSRFLGALPVEASRVHRPKNREVFYQTLGSIFGKDFEAGTLISPKMQLILDYQQALLTTPRVDWSELLLRAVKDLFEIENPTWRDLQKDGILRALDHQDLMVLLPTGGGKSLIFQLPALLSKGYTVVVSPLVALIQDQVQKLEELSLPVAGLWGGLSKAEQGVILSEVESGNVKLLYVSPERINRSAELQHMLKTLPPDRVVFDEAHCLLEWGHDFRPDYQHVVGTLKELGLKPPISAFTATLPVHRHQSLLDALRLNITPQDVLQTAMERKNLVLTVQASSEKNKLQQVVDIVNGSVQNTRLKGKRMIIYCGSRTTTEQIAAVLKALSFNAEAYHAGLSPHLRQDLVERFQAHDITVMVATNAFGMGIDAPDIHLVVHHDAPLSLEAYVQEVGRAGRDASMTAHAVLLRSSKDSKRARHLIQRSYPGRDEVEQILSTISKLTYPTERELAEKGDLETQNLPTVLHLLEEAGIIQYDYVPGWHRVFELYGVEKPRDEDVKRILQKQTPEGLHLSREFFREAAAVQEKLLQYAREGRLGVSASIPALKIDVIRHDLSAYEKLRKSRIEAKLERFNELERYLDRKMCRNQMLRQYFEQHTGLPCGHCDRCQTTLSFPWDLDDEKLQINLKTQWDPRREILSFLQELEKDNTSRGRSKLVALLIGKDGIRDFASGEFKYFSSEDTSSKHFGRLKFIEKDEVYTAVDQLLLEKKIEKNALTHGGEVLKLTPEGRELIRQYRR